MDGAKEGIEMEPVIESKSMSGMGRKRGHQHHIRQSGTRTSNVRADEVIAALRKGDQLPVIRNIHQYSEQSSLHSSDIDGNSTEDSSTTSEPINCVSNIATQCDALTDQNGNRKTSSNDTETKTLIDDLNKNTRFGLKSKNANILIDYRSEQPNKTNVISRDSDTLVESTMGSEMIGVLNSDIEMELRKDELNDSISSNSSSGSKFQSKKLRKSQKTVSEVGPKKGKRSRKIKSLPPSEERPPLEGADAEQWTEYDNTLDMENDPEVAEWSKLRCTSERTEVVAEREYRRQNRRCADYPGLAFGRSIFSSDTMMKFNIIRNELHNIMKTQLKRVCVTVRIHARQMPINFDTAFWMSSKRFHSKFKQFLLEN